MTLDANDRVTSFSNGVGTWTYSYVVNGNSQTTTVTDPLGHTRTVVANIALAEPTSDTDGLGRTTTYAYDSYGRVTQVTRPAGDVYQYTYDSRGNILQKTAISPNGSPANIVTSASYDSSCIPGYMFKCNKPNSTTDGNGHTTTYSYLPDSQGGGVSQITRPAGANGIQGQTTFTYADLYAIYRNAAGVLTSGSSQIWTLYEVSTCANSTASCGATSDQVISYLAYDQSGAYPNLLPIWSFKGDGTWSGQTTNYTYDAFGDVLTVQGPLGAAQTTRLRYDADRELIGMVGPLPGGPGTLLNRAIRKTYNADGRVTMTERGTVNSQSDSDWANFNSLQQFTTTYDTAGRKVLTSATGAGVQTVKQYAYDAANNRICKAVRMNPDAYGALPSSACALGPLGIYGPDRITYTTYDNANEVTTVTSGYGTASQRTDIDIPGYSQDGSPSYFVDGKGNRTTNYFDGLDRLTVAQFPTPSNGSSSNASDYVTNYYDGNSNIYARRRRDGVFQYYNLDALNNPLTGDNGATYGYDTLGRMTSASLNGQTLTFTYDALGHETSETGPLGTVNYTYDAAGHLTQITYPSGYFVTYAYDTVGELLSTIENGNYGIMALAYDNLGNRAVAWRTDGVTTSYAYDGLSRLTDLNLFFPNTGWDQQWTLAYNPASQITVRTSTNPSYDWTSAYNVTRGYTANGLNQLTTSGGQGLSYDARGNLTSDGTYSYSYNEANQLTGMSNGATLSYDPLGRLYQVTGSTTTRFLYAGDRKIAEYDGSGNLQRWYMPGASADETFVWYEGSLSTRNFIMTDTQGSTAMLADSSGNPQQLDRYDEAGIPGPVNIGRFQYMGQPYIPEIGLYDNRARIYSPNLGRFLQTDPIGYGDGMNWYNYAHGDPVNGSDPSGTEFAFEDDGGGGGGGGGGDGGDGEGGTLYDPPSCQDDPSCVGGPNVNASPFCASCFNTNGGSSASTSIIPIGAGPPSRPPAPKPSATVAEVVVTVKRLACSGSKALDRYSSFDNETANDAFGAGVATAFVPGAQEVSGALLATGGGFSAIATVEGVGSAILEGVGTGRYARAVTRTVAGLLGLALPKGFGSIRMKAAVGYTGQAGQNFAGSVADAAFGNSCP